MCCAGSGKSLANNGRPFGLFTFTLLLAGLGRSATRYFTSTSHVLATGLHDSDAQRSFGFVTSCNPDSGWMNFPVGESIARWQAVVQKE